MPSVEWEEYQQMLAVEKRDDAPPEWEELRRMRAGDTSSPIPPIDVPGIVPEPVSTLWHPEADVVSPPHIPEMEMEMNKAQEIMRVLTSGAIKGFTGLDWGDEDEEEVRKRYPIMLGASELAGFLGSFAVGGKGVQLGVKGIGKLLPLANKLPAPVKQFIRSKAGSVAGRVGQAGATGAVVGAGQQSLRGMVGQDVDWNKVMEEAILFGGVEGTLMGTGAALKYGVKTVKSIKAGRAAKKAVKAAEVPTPVKGVQPSHVYGSAAERTGGNARLQANDTFKGFLGPAERLTSPIVTRGELNTVMKVPYISPAISYLRQFTRHVGDKFTNPIRMHEDFGTKELMYRPVKAAEHRATVAWQKAKQTFDKTVRTIPLRQRGRASKRIGVYAISRQSGGMQILGDMGIKEIPTLKPHEMKIYDYMRTELERFYTEIQRARINAGVEPFKKIKDYFTFFRNVEGEFQKGHSIISIDARGVTDAFTRTATRTPFRFGKKRVLDSYGPVDLDAFNIFRQYGRSAIRHVEMTPTIAKMNELLDGSFYNGYRLADDNPEAYRTLREWVNFSAGQRVGGPTTAGGRACDRFLRTVNKNLAFAVLSYNIRSALIQPSALVNAMGEVGPKYTAIGIRSLVDPTKRKFIMDNSRVLSGRKMDAALLELGETIGGALSGAKKRVGEAGLMPLQWLDMETAKATWYGAYRRGTSTLKMSQREAANYADDIVTKTQASAAPSDLAPIQRTALGKSLTLFQTFVINNWGFITKDVLKMGRGGPLNKESIRKFANITAAAQLFNFLYEDLASSAMGTNMRSPLPTPIRGFMKEMERSGNAPAAAWESLREIAEEIPVLGGAARYGSSPFGAVPQFGQDVTSVLGSPGTLLGPKGAETFGKAVGVPGVTQAKKTYRWMNQE